MNDTIAAISTSLGVGAISIVRMSGKDSIYIANKIFDGVDLTKVSTHTIHYGYIIDGNEKIDEVLVTVMKEPKTFTRENVVEINCHGGIATTNRILEIILQQGARLADPGEFTKRSFINGRIDLIEAESVLELINSKNEIERKISMNGIQKESSEFIHQFRQELLELIANIEVNIDYPEYEDIETITIEHINSKVNNMKQKLHKVIEKSEEFQTLRLGINVAIVGRPNVGKSSLLNKLIDQEKAIVTDVEGTTRDLVEGSIILDQIPINFIDTAGIRNAKDKVEKIGIEKTMSVINQADLILLLLDNSHVLTQEDHNLLHLTKNKKRIIVVNKDDLPSEIDRQIVQEDMIFINTKNFDKVEQVKNKIKELFQLGVINVSNETLLNTTRQLALAKEALLFMEDVERGLSKEMPIDLIEIDIKKIWKKLGEIIGETYEEELVDQLFSQFCLGK